MIQPATPQVVYVPQYNSTVVYGIPHQPPGYRAGAMATGLISFGVGVAVGCCIQQWLLRGGNTNNRVGC